MDHDLALLKVAATGLPVAPWSNRQPKPGTIVASVGTNPEELVFGAVSSPVLEVPLEKGGRLTFDVQAPEPAEDAAGVQIINVWNETPALKPDIHEYDLLTHIADVPVPTTEEYRCVKKRILREAVAGDRVELRIQRGGQALTLKVPVESADLDESTFPYYGGRRSGFPKAFLHDAWVRRRHNGSAVVDVEGQVIAINVATWLVGTTHRSREPGMMYAIPADVVRNLLIELQKQ
jgi:S1-C subfamily serine protease